MNKIPPLLEAKSYTQPTHYILYTYFRWETFLVFVVSKLLLCPGGGIW